MQPSEKKCRLAPAGVSRFKSWNVESNAEQPSKRTQLYQRQSDRDLCLIGFHEQTFDDISGKPIHNLRWYHGHCKYSFFPPHELYASEQSYVRRPLRNRIFSWNESCRESIGNNTKPIAFRRRKQRPVMLVWSIFKWKWKATVAVHLTWHIQSSEDFLCLVFYFILLLKKKTGGGPRSMRFFLALNL